VDFVLLFRSEYVNVVCKVRSIRTCSIISLQEAHECNQVSI
jgi:hypothetical protein